MKSPIVNAQRRNFPFLDETISCLSIKYKEHFIKNNNNQAYYNLHIILSTYILTWAIVHYVNQSNLIEFRIQDIFLHLVLINLSNKNAGFK